MTDIVQKIRSYIYQFSHSFSVRKSNPVSNSENQDSHSNIVAVASHAGPKKVNEDRIISCSSPVSSYIIIADGLGGYPQGEVAAQAAVESFQEELQRIEKEKGIVEFGDLKPIYEKTALKLRNVTKGKGCKTTIICMVERPRDFIVSYLGDGQVYLVRGDAEIGIPLMISHRVGGLLGGTLGPELTANPVTIQVSKAFRSGEMLIGGSDGVFNPNVSKAKPMLLMELISFFREKFGLMQPNEILLEFLNQLHEQSLLDDNASLGLIISKEAREFMFAGRKT